MAQETIALSVDLKELNASVTPKITALSSILPVVFDNDGTPQLRAPTLQNILDDNLGTWVNALTGLTFSNSTKFFINNAGASQAIRWGDLRPVVLTAVEDDLLDPLVTSEIENKTAQSLDINITFNDFNVMLIPDTTQRFYTVKETVSGSPIDLFHIRTRTDSGGGTSQVGIFSQEFEVQATTAIFRNGLGVVGGELDLVGDLDISGEILQEQPNVGTEANVALLTQNRYHLNGSSQGRSTWLNKFWRQNVTQYFDGGSMQWKQEQDYSNASKASSSLEIYQSQGVGGNALTATFSSGGNLTITGTYSPFTGTHIVRYGNFECMPDFEPGKVVEVVEAFPNPKDVTDNDYRINICNTINSTKTKYILASEERLEFRPADLYSDDEDARKKAFEDASTLKTKKVDFFKDRGIDKPAHKTEQANNGKPPKTSRPAKLDQDAYVYYVYYVIAVSEGSCWTCDVNGNIQDGDYLSAFEDGFAQKSDAFSSDKTKIARAVGDVDFSDGQVVQINRTPRRVKLVCFEM